MQNYIPGHTLKLNIYDTKDSPSGNIGAAIQSVLEDDCVGVIASTTSENSELVQYVLQNYGVC